MKRRPNAVHRNGGPAMVKGLVGSSRQKVKGNRRSKAATSGGFENLISTVTSRNDTLYNSTSKAGLKKSHLKPPKKLLKSSDEQNRAVLLTIEPHFIFAYWEISIASMLLAAQSAGHDAKLVLRLYDITNTDSKDCTSWDVEVFDRQGNFYFKMTRPGQRLSFEMGMKGQIGKFSNVVVSDVVHMPEHILSKPGALKWLVTNNTQQDLADADPDLLKKTLGPYFHDLLMRGRFSSVVNSTAEALFHDIKLLKLNA